MQGRLVYLARVEVGTDVVPAPAFFVCLLWVALLDLASQDPKFSFWQILAQIFHITFLYICFKHHLSR